MRNVFKLLGLLIVAAGSSACFSPTLTNSEKSQDFSVSVGGSTVSSGTALIVPCGGQLLLGTSGVVGGATYEVVSGSGTIAADGTYTAPSAAGDETIRVTDSSGSSVDVSVTVKDVTGTGSSSLNVELGKTHQFLVEDSLSYSPGAGSFDSASGTYYAPHGAVSDFVTLSTANGTFSISVNVYSPLSVSFSDGVISVNASSSISASGGVPPYTIEVIRGSGTITGGVMTTSDSGHTVAKATDSIGNTATTKIRAKKCDLASSWTNVQDMTSGVDNYIIRGIFQDPVDGKMVMARTRSPDNADTHYEVMEFNGSAFTVVATYNQVYSTAGPQVVADMDDSGAVWFVTRGKIGGSDDLRIHKRPRGGSLTEVYDHPMTGVTAFSGGMGMVAKGTDIWMSGGWDPSGAPANNKSERYGIWKFDGTNFTTIASGYLPSQRAGATSCELNNSSSYNCNTNNLITEGPDGKIWAIISQEETDSVSNDFFHGAIMTGDENGFTLGVDLHDPTTTWDQYFYVTIPGFDDLGNFYHTFHQRSSNTSQFYEWRVAFGQTNDLTTHTNTNIDTTIFTDEPTLKPNDHNQSVTVYTHHKSTGEMFIAGNVAASALGSSIVRRGNSETGFSTSMLYQHAGAYTGFFSNNALFIDSDENVWAAVAYIPGKYNAVIRKLACN